MAWTDYSSGELTARKMKVSGNKGTETWTLATPLGVILYERTVEIAEYQADGWTEAAADSAVDALNTAGHKNAESSRSGESGKYMVRWTEETYGEWGLA